LSQEVSQKWPEIAGSKWRWFAKPGERFQLLSPKADVLPLHHFPPRNHRKGARDQQHKDKKLEIVRLGR
jgi:hypothetical protein